ncbi:TPR domain protein [Rubrivivax sp. A210]|uniref:XrtA/PEP-CTERM system TPR-repeat protein PrsT n=1 Tax=Rubrivivax sp. A210 TaxID=2772301 RepID=UPI001918F5AB|nr:XrtA/PEP-CTERM system TPR-repeat protein PrsT [Rubrivivax sp. A210]CAD5375200.1 TPR domain protein [Rubrivivax sp. A210]
MDMPTPNFLHRSRLAGALMGAVLALAACQANSPQALISSGKEFAAKKEHAAAIIKFKSALQSNPGNVEARMLLGESLLEVGEIEASISEFGKALAENAPKATVLPSLTRALVLSGDHKRLVSSYGDVKLDEPAAQAALKANVAMAWGALGDRPRTETAIAASLAAVPDYNPALILRARVLAGAGKFDEATVIVDGVLARDDKRHDAWLFRGEILSAAKNDFKGAETCYRKALAVEPAYIAAHAALISLQMRQRDFAGAKASADALRKAQPRHPYTILVDAQLAFLDKQYARSRDLVQSLLRVFPENRGALALGGAVEAQLGSVSQAAAYLNKALLLDPTLIGARRNLAEVQVRQGQYAKAVETLKPLLAAEQPWSDALALAGDAELRLGRHAVAERYFTRAAQLDPENNRLTAAAAMARFNSGDTSAALADLQQMSAKSKDTYADELIFTARMKRREYDAALATLDTMLAKQPGKAAHMELRGRVHMARRDFAAARKSFEQALAADPAMFAAVSSLADIDIKDGKLAQAIARLRASVKADPRNSYALMTLAFYLARDSQPDAAEIKKLYADAVAAAPTAPEPRLRQIDYAMRQRQYKDALQAAQEAAAAIPWDASILDAVGQTQVRTGDIEQAATTFRKLATALPDAPEPYMRLAELYLAAGRRDQAESATIKALDLNPNLASAQAALVEIVAGSSDKKAALNRLANITRANPRQPLGYILESQFHIKQKDNDAAAAILREGLAKTESSELAGRLYGLLMTTGRAAEADRFGTAWMGKHPKDAAFENLQANVDISRGDAAGAEKRLRRVVAANPNDVLALNNLAEVMVKIGSKGASEFAQRAVELQPDSAPLQDTLATTLAAEGKLAAALDVQQRAVEMSPKDNLLRLGLARIALQAGDKELARKELQYLDGLGAKFSGNAEVGRLMKRL